MKTQLDRHLESLALAEKLRTLRIRNSLTDSVFEILDESELDLKFSNAPYSDPQKTQVINKLARIAEVLAQNTNLDNFNEYSRIVTICARKITDEDRSLTMEMITQLNDIYKKCNHDTETRTS